LLGGANHTTAILLIRQHSTLYNGLWRVSTLQNDVDQLRGLTMKYHRQIGIIPEIKHSTYFRSIGLPMEQRLLDVLRSNGLDHFGAPVIIQSFDLTWAKIMSVAEVGPVFRGL
jgi:glycerophosphoryl diester phosphodiesterase